MADFFDDRYNGDLGKGSSPRARDHIVVPRHSLTKWREATQKLCIAQAVLGPLWLLLASYQLSGDSRMHSQIIGALMFAVGIAGYIGLRRNRSHLLILHLIAAGLGMVLVIQELSKIELQIRFHCTSAYTFLKLDNLEQHVAGMEHEEMFSAVYSRMNEIDDMLDMFQKGEIEKESQMTDKEPERDHFYVQAKLARLRGHADQVREALIEKKRKIRAEIQEAGISRTLEEQANRLEQGIAFATKVVERLTAKDDAKGMMPFTFEEYSQVLNMLKIQAGKGEVEHLTRSLGHESEQLPLLQGTWNRAMDKVVKTKQSEREDKASRIAADLRKTNREKWEANFRSAFGMNDGGTADLRPSLQQRMAGVMENLPQACMQETRAWYGFELLGWALIVFQGSVAYCIMVNLVQTPVKIS